MKEQKENLLKEQGQAFFEMIIFLPFMIFLVTIVVSFGNSINGAINQSKATRGYFHQYLRNNSNGFFQQDLVELNSRAGINFAGLFTFGWRVKSDGGGSASFAPCYKVSKFFGGSADEECDNPALSDNTTQFIRIYTYYGICPANFRESGNGSFEYFYPQNNIAGCSNTN